MEKDYSTMVVPTDTVNKACLEEETDNKTEGSETVEGASKDNNLDMEDVDDTEEFNKETSLEGGHDQRGSR